jgi:sarcosine oxidase, subunit alpha
VKFAFQGKPVEAKSGDTIAAALYRSGQRIFARSFKYHRPRGLLCVAGNCPNCMMNVEGVPNVRTCITPVREGVSVKSQNAFPSLETDFLSITQYFDQLMPVGWYYKTFTHPAVWHAVEPVIRKAAGLGEVLPTQAVEYEHAWMHADTAVVGGGWAGIHAALEAGERGDQVVLIDDQPRLGGQLRYRKSAGDLPSEAIAKLRDTANIQVLQDSYCFGIYEGNLLGVLQRNPSSEVVERLVHLRTRSVVVATGTYETPILFPNNDLVGVMLSTGVQRLLHLYGVVAGKRAVIVGGGEAVTELSANLRAAGIEIAALVGPKEIVAATGSKQVTGIRTSVGNFSCDLIVVCGPRVPNTGLVAQAGGKLEWSAEHGAFFPADRPGNVSVVGDAAGEMPPNADVPLLDDNRAPEKRASDKRVFVCLCSDVSANDLCDGVAQGFDQIETLKRYTTATMGPCQGRMCQLSTIGVCARETGRSMAETGVTTSRPPNPSVTLGALAGPGRHPTRHTPMHYSHDGLGAVWMDMGGWKRPRYYKRHARANESESVLLEYKSVRERVGIIDVSTLGKLDVRGKDAGNLLDIVYTHRFSDLRTNQARYALMCDQGGIILDDGTISRLAEDRYFVTTTSGNLDFVYQWLQWQLTGTNWDVHICNVTAGYGAMNLAGPSSRNVLRKLVDCDLSSAAFPYMACREAMIGKVPAILLRIGFVGETGWEIHCPAESAEDLWQTLLDAGKEFGIQAFGVAAQRLLRLEKRHVIVGVDTDALTNPYDAGLGWAVKLGKKDFIGKALLSSAAHAQGREKLVGFTLKEAVPPKDGAAIVLNGQSAGRVTSSHFSPIQKAAIGLAWVKETEAREGASIQVRVDGKLTPATVTLRPFYDPEGLRLRQ